MDFEVAAVCTSKHKGEQKLPVQQARFVRDWGLKQDAHAGRWHRQVSLLDETACASAWERMARRDPEVYAGPGAFGENVLTRGMDWSQVRVGDRVSIGAVELEITQLGKPLHQENAILRITGESVLPDNGVFARVVQGGTVHAGDRGYHHI